MTEAQYSKGLSKFLKHHGFFVQRIESGTTGAGIPDIFCITPNKKPLWIELKCIQPGTKNIPWHGYQLQWLYNCCQAGVLTITLVRRVKTDYMLFKHDKLFLGNQLSILPEPKILKTMTEVSQYLTEGLR